MLICLDCGKTFEEHKLRRVATNLGEWCGVSISQEDFGCPYCLGDFEEAIKCENCGEWFPKERYEENHLCEKCRPNDDDDEE